MFSKSVNILRIACTNSMCRRGLAIIDMEKVGIIGVPFGKGQRRGGVQHGPKAIRDAGLIQEIHSFNQNVDVKDYGDIPEVDVELKSMPKNMLNYATAMGTMRNLSHRVCEILNEDRICLTLGGDHTIAIG